MPDEPSTPLRTEQRIRINTLLLEREALFVRIHELEQAAAQILGEPYPFTKPPLPSDGKGRRLPPKRRSEETEASAPKLRRLQGSEYAYRLTYRQFGQTVREDHPLVEPLQTLLACQSENLHVARIETVDAGGRTLDVLYTAQTSGH